MILRIESRGDEIHVTIEPPRWLWLVALVPLVVALVGLVAILRSP